MTMENEDRNVAEPARHPEAVIDAIRLLSVYKTWIGGDRPDDEDEARLWDETEATIAALAHPQPTDDGMVSVVTEDANNYCRILTALGMEEEGDPVAEVERLVALAEAPTVEQTGDMMGEAGFTGWFVKNYPGPNTIISNPLWHAPRIFRNAMYHAEPRPAGVSDDAALLRDLRQFHEETEACSEFDLPNEAIATLLVANLIEGTHYMLTKKGEAMLAAAPAQARAEDA